MTSAAAEQNQTDTTTNYNPIKNQEFNPTPRNIQMRTDLTASAKAIYGYLASCYGRDGLIFPKVSTIANQCGLSMPTVTRAIFTLKQKRLIDTVRTGRASRYIFLNPNHVENTDKNVDQVSENQAENDNQINQNDLSEQSKCDDQPPIYKKTPSKEKQTTAGVVSLDDRKKQKAFDAVPEKYRTPAVKRIVNEGLSRGLDYVLQAIKYTNHHSSTNYAGYLAGVIKNNYAEGWTAPEAVIQRSEADIAKQDKEDRDALNRKQEADKHREALADEWMMLPETERQQIRDEYLSKCSKFEKKRAYLMSDKKLSGTISFRLFLERKKI